MKRSIWLAPLFLLALVFSAPQGCRKVAVPTFPQTPTNTPTITSTPTNTPIITNTPSSTATNSPTNSPTSTPTITPTGTVITDTPTNSPTNSPTNTPTNSPTNTPTAGSCTPVPLSSYTFDSCTQGWTLDGSIAGEVIAQSSTTFHTGPGAWEGIINFDSTNNSEEVNISFPCGTFQNLQGAAITMWVYSTAAANAQMFCNYGTGVASCYQGYQNPGYCSGTGCAGGQTGSYATLNPNTWTMVTFNPALTAPDGQYVSKFGVNILNCTSPATIYIDDVTVTSLATATPTPAGCTAAPTFTPSYPFTWNNDNYCTVPSGWSSNNNSGTIVVPSLLLSTLQNHTSACSTGCSSVLMGPVPFTAANQSANVEYVFPNGTAGTDLTGRTISAWYYLDAAPSDAGYGVLYIQTGANGTPTYNYQNAGFGGTYALTTGAWTQISIPANQGGADPRYIWKFGFQIGTGGTATTGFQNVNFYVDDMTIQ